MYKKRRKIIVLFCAAILANGFAALAQTQNTLTDKEKQEGWQLLFDGKTFDGLKMLAGSGWEIENGVIQAQVPEEGEGHQQRDFITEKTFGDFELVFEFKIFDKTNSGVKYLVTNDYHGREGEYLGLEYQILDEVNFEYPERGELRTLASLYDLISADKKETAALDQWYTTKIVVNGDHIAHWLNGQKTVDYNRGSEKFKSLVQGSKYKDLNNFGQAEKGHILFQNEGSAVSFRNIKIKNL